MTIDEAIQILNLYDLGNMFLDIDGNPIGYEKMSSACDMAVEALKALKQATCEDTISRQAVLDIDFEKIILTTAKPAEMIEQKINALSPVTPQPTRWIPVSERLPESSGVYIVTREFSDGFECADLTDACYFDGTSTWHNDNRINHGREYLDKKIKAWMPLPEPYKAESEE